MPPAVAASKRPTSAEVTALRTALKTPTRPASMGSLIDQAWALREEKRALDAKMKVIEEKASALEAQVMETLEKQGVTSATGSKASFSISYAIVPQIGDWDLFLAFLHKHKAYHLLERRPAVAACREMFEKRGMIPGATAYNKPKISLRSL